MTKGKVNMMTLLVIVMAGLFVYLATVLYLYQNAEMPDLPDWEEDRL